MARGSSPQADAPDRSGRTTIDLPAQAVPDDEDVTAETRPPDEQHCSFCNKPRTEVARLVTGPTLYICDQCVELAGDIIADELGR